MKSGTVARFVTDAVMRRPALWPVLRVPMRRLFDRIAHDWETRIGPQHLAALEHALAELPAPRRALDLGTGTGRAARLLAHRFPGAMVVGVDLAPAMVEQARRLLPDEVAARVRYEVADASRLPFEDGAFELVTLANAIPFFDELERVTASGGAVVFSFSRGAETPIYVPFERLREELGRRGFSEFREFSAPPARAISARKV